MKEKAIGKKFLALFCFLCIVKNHCTYESAVTFTVETFLKHLSVSETFMLLNNSFDSKKENSFLWMAGIGCRKSVTSWETDKVDEFIHQAAHDNEIIFTHLTYNLKNKIEKLSSRHADDQAWPEVHFFIPEYVITSYGTRLEIETYNGRQPDDIYKSFSVDISEENSSSINNEIKSTSFKPALEVGSYLQKIEKILYHIRRGDIYEMNYCFPFVAHPVSLNPFQLYLSMCASAPAPFSCFYRMKEHFLLCSSPERFIKRKGSTIYSQPIKGTAPRGATDVDDESLKKALLRSEKERAENVMIVDLVRNDLSKIAERGSVKVDELFGLYTFPSVHQLISTISATVKKEVSFSSIINALFPMGSMTGAPKISAMKFIDELEEFNRGLYSGAVGYILPGGDFDFNVVIRSILFNQEKQLASIPVGSAITQASDPLSEYEECHLKARALIRLATAVHHHSTTH